MRIFIWRPAGHCPYEWAEVEYGLPVHPSELQERVRSLIARDESFATYSDTVLSMLGWMVRKREITLPLSVIYVDIEGKEHENPIDVDGMFVYPWPEEGFESIQDAGFHYRFD